MTAVQLADGVWRLPLAPGDVLNAFLLAGDDGTLTLVDAGLRSSASTVRAALGRLGRRPEDVTHLLLSHYDVAGFAHGPEVSTGAQAAVRAFLAGRPS